MWVALVTSLKQYTTPTKQQTEWLTNFLSLFVRGTGRLRTDTGSAAQRRYLAFV